MSAAPRVATSTSPGRARMTATRVATGTRSTSWHAMFTRRRPASPSLTVVKKKQHNGHKTPYIDFKIHVAIISEGIGICSG